MLVLRRWNADGSRFPRFNTISYQSRRDLQQTKIMTTFFAEALRITEPAKGVFFVSLHAGELLELFTSKAITVGRLLV